MLRFFLLLLTVGVASGAGCFETAANFALVADVGSSGTVWTMYDVSGADAKEFKWGTVKAQGDGKSGTKWTDAGNTGTSQLATIEVNAMAQYWTHTKNLFTASGGRADTMWTRCQAAGNACGYGTSDALWADLKKLNWLARATAGMREKDLAPRFTALAAVMEQEITGKVDLKIISGAVEGLLGFMSNAPKMGGDEDKTIYVEVGGASAQIAFTVPCASIDSDDGVPFGRLHATTHLVARRLLGLKKSIDSALQPELLQTETVKASVSKLARAEGFARSGAKCYFSTSFMGYGGDELAGLVTNGGNGQPCLTEGVTVTQTGTTATATADKSDGATVTVSVFDQSRDPPDWTAGKKLPWTREIAWIGSKQGTAANRATTGSTIDLGAGETCETKLQACMAQIAATAGDNGHELRGRGDGLTFASRWQRIQSALKTAGLKTTIYYVAAANGKHGRKCPADGHCTEAQIRANFKGDGSNTGSCPGAASYNTKPDDDLKKELSYGSFTPLVSATMLYMTQKLSGYNLDENDDEQALTLKAVGEFEEWTGAAASNFKAGKTFNYLDAVREKFTFDVADEVEMDPLTLAPATKCKGGQTVCCKIATDVFEERANCDGAELATLDQCVGCNE